MLPQVRTLTTQEWKAEQQLGEPVDTTRGVSSSCQFCEQAKQQCFGLDRNLHNKHTNRFSDDENG